ncbi:MAG: T9SS type A sorting domain-containing protein [Bacteroidota bacterium]
MVQNGHFEAGDVDPANPNLDFTTEFGYIGCPPPTVQDLWGSISLQTDPSICYSGWSSQDHTMQNGAGTMLIADFPSSNPNGSSNFMDIWAQTITVSPNQTYCFGAWFKNLSVNSGYSLPNFRFMVNGSLIGTSPDLPENGQWEFYGFTYTTAVGQTSLNIAIQNGKFGGDGNDLAIDDVEFRESVNSNVTGLDLTPDAALCVSTDVDYPINILGNDTGIGTLSGAAANSLNITMAPDTLVAKLSINNVGEILFTPQNGFFGTTYLMYEVCDNGGCCDETYVQVDVAQILPVQFEGVKAERSAEGAWLSWKMNQATPGGSYEVWRSTATEARTKVGQVAAGPQTTYQFLDRQAPRGESVWYQLSLKDVSGAFYQTDVIELTGAWPSQQVMRVYPNPSPQDFVKLEWAEELTRDARVEILNTQGKKLSVQVVPAGLRLKEVYVGDLANGTYFIRWFDGKKWEKDRLVLMR